MALAEGRFSLDGYIFGLPDNDVIVLEEGFTTGYAETRTQDAEMPRADGILVGRDYLGAPTWSFTLGVRADGDRSVYDILAELARAWRADDVRFQPGKTSFLRFTRGGEEQVVFGRPRRFAVTASRTADNEWQVVEADFQLTEPLIYSWQTYTLRMGLIEQASSGGLVLPSTAPLTLAADATSTRKGVVDVQGYTSTPAIIRFYGPTVSNTTLTDAWVRGAGLYVHIDAPIRTGQIVEVDTRTRTVMSDGVSLAGSLTPGSRLSARLQPGTTEFQFSGNDSSYTSQVEILWRTATYSI